MACLVWSASHSASLRAQPEKLAELDSAEVQVRRDATQRVKNHAHELEAAELERLALHLANEKDAQVRLNIFDVATSLGSRAEPMVPALLQSLRREHRGRRNEELHQDYRAAMALASIGPPAVSGLKELLGFSRPNVRAEAAMALARIGAASAGATSELAGLLGDENERVRDEAAKALASIGQAALPAVLEMARHGTLAQKTHAIGALGLGAFRDEAAATILREALASPEVTVRAAAIAAARRCVFPQESMLAIASENLAFSDERVRRAMMRYLMEGGSEGLVRLKPELIKLLGHADAGVATDSAFLLQAMGLDAVQGMIDAFARESSRLDSLAEAISLLGTPAVPWLVAGMQDPRDRVREGCAVALGQVRPLPADALGIINQGMSDRMEGVQIACLKAMGQLGPRARTSLAIIEDELTSTNPAMRAAAVKAIFQVAPRSETTVRKLAALVDDQDPTVQLNAIQVLHASGPVARSAVSQVLPLLENSERAIQSAALEFIASHGRSAYEAASPLVRLLVSSTDQDLRLKVLQTLSQLGRFALAAKDHLSGILESDADVPLKIAALDTIANLELPLVEIRPLLSKALTEGKEDLRRRALRVIRKYGAESNVFLADLIGMVKADEKDDSYLMRDIQRLEKHGLDASLVPRLVELLSSGNTKQIQLAIRFLGLAEPDQAKAALPKLEELSNHDDEALRQSASQTLRKLSKAPTPTN